ncbi:MAG TPA: wax ester/triacylglycerol synthase family O-acyltransferase [Mycobacteriales bacterium]|nr:wax ester/triacylglycerol synthase family O-acyltransferase [Mycobacteriales bacterium]
MHQLTGLDTVFLSIETATTYGHVGSVAVLEPPPGRPLTLDRVTAGVESRLHLIPPFRRRLAQVPLGLDNPYWIDDPDFDIEFHVRELALPAPGDDRQLASQLVRLHARPLDRQRPLWELYLIHGLAGGRQAVYTKVHHAAIDGVSGNDILTALLDLAPDGREGERESPQWAPETAPGTAAMLARSLGALAGNPWRAVRMSAGLARSVPRLVTLPARPRLPLIDRLLRRDDGSVLSQSALRAPATPFNRSISAHRNFAMARIPLDQIKPLRVAFGLTVNDVVMALCAGALRRWLLEHDALPDAALLAGVPISVRTTEQSGTLGNRVSTMIAPIPTHLSDPAERLRAAHDAMRAAKDQHQALPANLLADVNEFAMPALAGRAARAAARLRLIERVRPFNLMISNVPGPNRPLYLAGAQLVGIYPLSAITDGQGLNITVLGYLGALHFGFISCRELVPDLDRMAEQLDAEMSALRALAEQKPAATVTPAGTAKSRRSATGRGAAAG